MLQNWLISSFERCLIKMSNYLSTSCEGEPILKGSAEGFSSVIVSFFLSKIGKTDSNFATMQFIIFASSGSFSYKNVKFQKTLFSYNKYSGVSYKLLW